MNITSSPDDALEAFNARKIGEYVPAIAYSALVIVLGVVGNVFTVAYYGFHEPRTSTNVIITALGTADLIACIAFSNEIIELCFTLTFKNVALCKSLSFCNQTLVVISGCIMLLVAVDRYRHICTPFAWQLSVNNVRIVIAGIVMFSVLHSAKNIVIADVVQVNITDPFTDRVLEAFYCAETWESGMQMLVAVSNALDLVTFLLIIGSCVVLYTLIARALLMSRKKFGNKSPRQDYSSSIRRDNSISHVYTSNTDITQDTYVTQDTNVTPDTDVTQDTISKTEKYHTETHSSDQKSTRRSKNGNRTNARSNVERKLTLMMLTITVASISSFIPYFVYNIAIKVMTSFSN